MYNVVCRLGVSEIDERVKLYDLLPTLQSDPPAFYTAMEKSVYPGIHGSDHARLGYYYTLLEGCEPVGATVTPRNHVKLLQTLSTEAEGKNTQ